MLENGEKWPPEGPPGPIWAPGYIKCQSKPVLERPFRGAPKNQGPPFGPHFWIPFWTPCWTPILDPVLDPMLDPILDPIFGPQFWTPFLDPMLETILDPMLDPMVGPMLDPIFGPQFWTPFWTPLWTPCWTPFWNPPTVLYHLKNGHVIRLRVGAELWEGVGGGGNSNPTYKLIKWFHLCPTHIIGFDLNWIALP